MAHRDDLVRKTTRPAAVAGLREAVHPRASEPEPDLQPSRREIDELCRRRKPGTVPWTDHWRDEIT
jgi:hypothetical protein